MINRIFFSLVSLLCLSLLTACHTNVFGDDEGGTSSPASSLVVLQCQSPTSPYDALLYNTEATGMAMTKFQEATGHADYMDCIISETRVARIRYNEQGLVKNITIVDEDSLMVFFDNYSGNKVDVVIRYNEEVAMLKEYECDRDWESLLSSVAPQADTRGIIFENRVQEELGTLGGVSKYMLNQFTSMINYAREGANVLNGAKPGKLALEFGKWVEAIFDPMLSKAVSVTLSVVDTVSDLAPLIKAGSIPGWAWFLVSHYDEVESCFEQIFLKWFEFRDWLNDDSDAAWGMLHSGFGALKVTLSWGFYADVDLHAIEPSGEHIYYNHKRSSFSDGYLDVDNREGGLGAVENIYWENPENGIYEFYIKYYGTSTKTHDYGTGTCTVTVLYNGSGSSVQIPLGVYDQVSLSQMMLPFGTFLTKHQDSRSARMRLEVDKGEVKLDVVDEMKQ